MADVADVADVAEVGSVGEDVFVCGSDVNRSVSIFNLLLSRWVDFGGGTTGSSSVETSSAVK